MIFRQGFLCLLAALLFRVPAEAQTPRKEAVLLRAARLLDVRTGQILPDRAILVVGDRIAEVGEAAKVAAAAGKDVRVIELPGATLLPGLIDCHAHLLGNLKDLSAARDLRTSSAQGALWGVHNVQIWLDHGFTALRDAGEADLDYGQLALRDSIRKGLLRGPRMVSAGNFVSVTGGHGDADVLAPDQGLAPRPNLADDVDGIASAVRRDLKYGADWIKLMATGGVSDPWSDFNVQELSEEQMARAVELAHRAGRRVMAHAEGTQGIKAAVRAGVDSIEHGTMLDEEGAALMSQRGTWLVPTLSTFQHAERDAERGADPVSLEKVRAILKHQQPAFERALRYHLKIAYGLDDDPDFLPQEFRALVRGGMKPTEALAAATIHAAELLGLSDQIGTLEPGKYADIIAVQDDPSKDIGAMEKVIFVMKGGELIKNLAVGRAAAN
ncbi:MAG: amidohydrolase family protein [Thermoanaerobaculia bacterium]